MLTGVLMFSCAVSAYSQAYPSVPVTISTEKVKAADGTMCYSHIVRERQTVYSISKAYQVSIGDIYKYNPKLPETGLMKNIIILIPVVEKEKPEVKQETAVITKEEKKQETVVVKKDTVVQEVPAKTTVREPIIHVRKWTEDLDAIARKYGVTVEALMKANNLKGRKLKRRQKLIIPIIEEEPKKEVSMPSATDTVSVKDPADSLQTAPVPKGEEIKRPRFLFPKSKVKASLLLPLTKEGKPSRIGMNFYCGALMAMRELGEEGISAEITVHDINSTETSSEMLSGKDLIIGPFAAGDLGRLLAQTSSGRKVISPMDMRAEALTETYPNLTQTRTPARYQYMDLVDWISEDMTPRDSIILISEKSGKVNEIADIMMASLDSAALKYRTFTYSILEGRDITEPLTALTTQEGTNRILIASDSEAFVNDVVRNINLLIYNNIDLVIYAPGKTRSFETIEVDHFHKASMHLSIADFIDYNDQKVKDFIMKYRALYNTEPDSSAFQGYDVISYFISLCQKYGNDWPEMLEESDREMLQGTFRFRRNGGGGYINTGVRRIIYENGYSVSKIR